ncbi:hypothetical protein BJY01DRAFT_262857 [Aspergillus pseudoustus]|uniref:Rieske domain-containing protein n=1 Tax=Aspergillus pseudoustus TaxID=1810923 RepID=A0ABR4IAP9_9EURO
MGGWHFAGNVSSYPDIHGDKEGGYRVRAGCRTLCIPQREQPQRVQMSRSNLDEQVIVFKYKGSIHAIDNKCPHSSFPLGQGSIYDIEDAGAGIRCFRHGWSFDLLTGQGDRGTVRLALWEIQLRDPPDESDGDGDKEIWVKRRS